MVPGRCLTPVRESMCSKVRASRRGLSLWREEATEATEATEARLPQRDSQVSTHTSGATGDCSIRSATAMDRSTEGLAWKM